LPKCTVGSRQAEHESRRVDGREDDMVKSMAIAPYRDETIRREGLQARVRDKILSIGRPKDKKNDDSVSLQEVLEPHYIHKIDEKTVGKKARNDIT
jgi:hypothetical protein